MDDKLVKDIMLRSLEKLTKFFKDTWRENTVLSLTKIFNLIIKKMLLGFSEAKWSMFKVDFTLS